MSDNSGAQAEPSSEPPAGQGILGAEGLQPSLDSNTRAVTQLGADISSLAGKIGGTGANAGSASSGVAAGAQNRGTGATGTGSGGGYAGMLRSFTPFGSASGANGQPGGGGGGMGGGGGGGGGAGSGGWRGSVQTGAAVLGAAGAYGNANMNSYMTMNTAATQAMWRSGLAAGGVNTSLGQATRMIYGSNGSGTNVTAASVQDAASANAALGYTSGVGMYGATGAANPAYQQAQSSMFAMGYANPYMTQTQVAGSMQSMYSPRSVQAMTALGVKLPAGPVLPQTASPMAIAQSVFGRTFQGQSSVNATTMTAATGQGGSLDSNLKFLAQQAGWSGGTVNMMETYLQQRNSAVQAGLPASQVDTLLSQAATGSKSATSTLAKYGIGASTVQSVKTLQAAQTSNLADQSGGFNTALQQSTSLLTDFNQVLGQILGATGISGAIGSTAGYGSMLGSVAGAAGAIAGMGGSGGVMGIGGMGGGFSGGGMGGGAMGTAGSMGMNFASQFAGIKAAQWGAGKATSGWNSLRNRFGSAAQSDASAAASQSAAAAESAGASGVQEMLPGMEGLGARVGGAGAGEAAATAAGGMSLGMGLGLGAGAAYVGSHVNNYLASNVYGHTGAGDSWVSSGLKVAGNTAAYAGAGALVGSAVPLIGTAAGAVVGGAIGLGQGLYDWITGGSGYSASNASTASANYSPSVPGGYSSGLGDAYTAPSVTGGPAPVSISATGLNAGFGGGLTTGSIGGGTDSGTTSTAGPASVTPALGAGNAGAAQVNKVVAFAVAQVNKPYVYAATGPDSYDCSGLTMASYAAAGIKIPCTSEQQMTAGSPVKPADALPGDLMFPNPGHVMICIGGGRVVEARHTGTNILIRGYSPGEFTAARRIITLAAPGATQNSAASGGNAATPGQTTTGMTSGIASSADWVTAGTSELQALQANSANALTDVLTATLRLTAANAPFGVPALSATLNTANPFANTGAAGAASAGTTALNGTVKDAYGHTYKIPSGAKPAGSVTSWVNQALSDMGMSPNWAADIKDIITGESGGNPWSINLTDSNAAAGHPSEGIMQTIPGTFSAHAMAGHKDIWNPVDDIIAGTKYAIATYKSLDNVPGVRAVKAGRPYVGYAAGAWDLPSDQIAALHKGEMVLPARSAQSVRQAVISDALGANTAKGVGGGVALHFRPGSIQITIGGQVSAATAQQTGAAIVDAIANDPRVKKMAVGL